MVELHRNHADGMSRRAVLGGLAGGLLLPALAAAEDAPVGTYPAGVASDSVFVGITVPLTGAYAAQGQDVRKGFELAVEHLNTGNELIRKLSPLTKRGVLGKSVTFGVADSEAKPNTAIQAQTRFITQNKAIMIAGSVSSAVAVALNKLAQREKVIYLPGISGSNDTTGKDCVRYGFRTCFYGYTAAAALAPVLAREIGHNKKVAYLTPDYTFGHTVQQSVEAFTKGFGWTTATNQVAPLGAPDFSTFLLNIANSGADVFVDIGFGADAVNSVKQAKQFGILDKMKLVVPYNTPFLAQQVGAELMQGVYASSDFWWTYSQQNEIARMFVEAFEAKYHYKPEFGADDGYLQFAFWADAVERAGTFYPPAVIKAYEAEVRRQSTVGEVYFRAADHQLVRPIFVLRGKAPAAMKGSDDYYDIVELTPGASVMQPPTLFGCKLGPYT
jgi:ABC-type branched-subunit amino acid transport system substrate-binding protein